MAGDDIGLQPSCLLCHEASESIMFPGCLSVRLSVRSFIFVLRQHGPTEFIIYTNIQPFASEGIMFSGCPAVRPTGHVFLYYPPT